MAARGSLIGGQARPSYGWGLLLPHRKFSSNNTTKRSLFASSPFLSLPSCSSSPAASLSFSGRAQQHNPTANVLLAMHHRSVLTDQRAGYTSKQTRDYERMEGAYDWTRLRDQVWPAQPAKQVEPGAYVPPDEGDEDFEYFPAFPDKREHLGGRGTPPKALKIPIPRLRTPQLDVADGGSAHATGSRKHARAIVWVRPGKGRVFVNQRLLSDYFPSLIHRQHILQPLLAVERLCEFDIACHAFGGGTTGQAGAIRMALARALEAYEPDFRPALKKARLLTRDARMVERKKTGRVKARKSPQWSKR